MLAFIENKKIKLRREGIFLCLDGCEWSDLWERLYHFINIQCISFNIPLRICLLSWDKELTRVPAEDFLSSNNFSRRGRFITPLVENIFSKLNEKEYELILISSGKIYDWTDWQDEMSLKIKKIYSYDLKELEQKNQLQLEKLLLEEIFNFKIGEVLLCFENGVCYDYPDGFRLKINKGKFTLIKNFNSRFDDISIKTSGPGESTRITVNLCDSTEEINYRNINVEVVPFNYQFSDIQKETFFRLLEGYRKKEFKHKCPLCGVEHKFARAFTCNQQKSSNRIFTSEQVIFKEVEKERRENSRCMVFLHNKGILYYKVFDKSILCVGDKEFIAFADEGGIFMIKISDKLEISELIEIHRGLFYFPEDIYILNLR